MGSVEGPGGSPRPRDGELAKEGILRKVEFKFFGALQVESFQLHKAGGLAWMYWFVISYIK